jgi:adenylate kinase
MLGRARKEGRADDTPEVISHRLEVYRQQTAPLIDYYSDRQILVSVDGDRSLNEVTTTLKELIAL